MTTNKLTSWILSSLLLGCLGFPAILSADQSPTSNTVVLDVALDAGTLTYSRPDAASTGALRGDSYLVTGYVYPGFTIPDGDAGASFLPDPSSSSGGIVITGIFVDDATSDSPMVSSTHVFSFDNGDGLVTQGLEGALAQFRALLGGTGQYSGSVGQVTEQVLGTNATGGYNMRFTFQLVELNPQNNSASPATQAQRARKLKAAAPRRRQ